MQSIKVADIRQIMEHLDGGDDVYYIATQPGFQPLRGMFVAQGVKGGGNALVVTDYDINEDPGALQMLGIPINFTHGGNNGGSYYAEQ